MSRRKRKPTSPKSKPPSKPMPTPSPTDHHTQLIEWIPFAAIWLGTRAADRPLLTRSIEGAIVAGMSAALAIYVNDTRQDEKLAAITRTVQDQRADLRADLADLRADIAALRNHLLSQRRP